MLLKLVADPLVADPRAPRALSAPSSAAVCLAARFEVLSRTARGKIRSARQNPPWERLPLCRTITDEAREARAGDTGRRGGYL